MTVIIALIARMRRFFCWHDWRLRPGVYWSQGAWRCTKCGEEKRFGYRAEEYSNWSARWHRNGEPYRVTE